MASSRIVILLLSAICFCSPTGYAQTIPFSGGWSFEGTDTGTSSNTLISLSSVSYVGVNKLAVNPYTAGYVSQGVNVQNWSTAICNNTEYVQFTAQPLGTAKLTLTNLTFAFSRSNSGPVSLSLRSSVDNFGADIYTSTITTNYQVASVTFSAIGFIQQAVPITFRIYACNPTAGGGTLKLDEIQFNGSSLPVTLLSFAAKPAGDRVQLNWSTTSEQDASHFIVERSADLSEFTFVDQVSAKGTTDQRQYYGVTDKQPVPGNNYYRLRQVDRDGTFALSKPVSAVVESAQVVMEVYPNPVDPARIHMRLWNADDATIDLLTLSGTRIDAYLQRRSGEADLIPLYPLARGVYLIELRTNGQKQVCTILVN
jgi:hypothetical protein